MHRSPKQWLHIIGGLFGVAGVVFVVLRLHTYAAKIDFYRFNFADWSIIGLLALAYGAANVLLARAWWCFLRFLEVKAQWRWVIKAYGLSQVAKYVPGNIFHLAGRQALGMAAGLPAKALAKSALWELGMIAIAGALFSVLTVPLMWHKVSPLMSSVIFLLMLAALLATISYQLSQSVTAALIWQMLFLAVSGAIFICILLVTTSQNTAMPAFSLMCGAYVIGWLVGLVTPGAPAGVGVREVVLLLLLGSQIAEAELLLAVVLGRVVTVLGDLFYFMVSTLLKKRSV